LSDVAATRTGELSHGQRRLLEVAVALTLHPKAFLMDEPMAGLGLEGSKRMTGFLDGLRSEAPILLVEHDMDAVFALADRISVLVSGAVIATGTPDQIRQSPEVRRAYLGEDFE
ncbi:MAG: ATP-binding cassette domain-containing protein, partial [Pseudomonadota bacterium]